MTAIWQTMNGHAGLPGWRWVFIICGIVTIPVAVFGFAFFPDLPETTKAFYLSQSEKGVGSLSSPAKEPRGPQDRAISGQARFVHRELVRSPPPFRNGSPLRLIYSL